MSELSPIYFVNKSQGGERSQIMRLNNKVDLRERPPINKAIPSQ